MIRRRRGDATEHAADTDGPHRGIATRSPQHPPPRLTGPTDCRTSSCPVRLASLMMTAVPETFDVNRLVTDLRPLVGARSARRLAPRFAQAAAMYQESERETTTPGRTTQKGREGAHRLARRGRGGDRAPVRGLRCGDRADSRSVHPRLPAGHGVIGAGRTTRAASGYAEDSGRVQRGPPDRDRAGSRLAGNRPLGHARQAGPEGGRSLAACWMGCLAARPRTCSPRQDRRRHACEGAVGHVRGVSHQGAAGPVP